MCGAPGTVRGSDVHARRPAAPAHRCPTDDSPDCQLWAACAQHARGQGVARQICGAAGNLATDNVKALQICSLSKDKNL